MPRREKRALSFSPEASPPLELRAGHAFYEPNRRYPLFRMGEHFSAAPEMPQEPSHELEQRHGGEHHFPAQNNKTQSANAQPPYDAGNDQASPHDAAAYSQAQHTQDYLRQQFYHYSYSISRPSHTLVLTRECIVIAWNTLVQLIRPTERSFMNCSRRITTICEYFRSFRVLRHG